jgi:hypothetical protein
MHLRFFCTAAFTFIIREINYHWCAKAAVKSFEIIVDLALKAPVSPVSVTSAFLIGRIEG